MGDWITSFLLMGALSTGGTLPFWASANQFGLAPESNGVLATASIQKDFNTEQALQYRCGASLAFRADGMGQGLQRCNEVMVDEFYGSLRWKVLVLDVGFKHRELDFYGASTHLGSLSTTGGHLLSGVNARSMPGYNLVCQPVAIPFTKERLWFYGSFGDYKMLDNRYVTGTLCHRMSLYLKVCITSWMDFSFGLDHYALWGGLAPGQAMNNSVNFSNYFRVITGRAASASGSQNDQMNVLGDHGGAELLRFDFKGNGWKIVFQHDIPYSDKSGMKFQNFPDGVNTLSFSFNDKKKWVSDVLYEFAYTMYQSGPIHDPEVDEHGNPIPWNPSLCFIGRDDYFNNMEYKSGWTYYGRPMTLPLMFPVGTKAGTWSRHQTCMGFENTRLIAHHIGLSGMLFLKAPYKLMLTFSQNYGSYGKQYAGENPSGKPWGTVKETPLLQFSAAFVGEWPNLAGVKGLNLQYGIYGDIGEVLKNNFALTLGLRYCL